MPRDNVDPNDPGFQAFALGRDLWDAPQSLPGIPRLTPSPRGLAVTRSGGQSGLVPVTAPHWYGSLIEAVQAVGTTPLLILQLSADPVVRNFLAIRNSSATQNLYIGFGNAPSVNSWCRLAPNTIILFDTVVPQNDLWAVCDAAGGQVSWGYGTTRDQ